MKLITPVRLTPEDDLAWETMDVSAYIEEGDTAVGVILQIYNGHFGTAAIGWRMTGSTQDIRTANHPSMMTAFCGLNANNEFDLYAHSAQQVYLIGYFTQGEAKFFTDKADVTSGSSDSWQDTDITSLVGTDTPIAAIVEVEYTGTGAEMGLRKKGSTDEHINATTTAHHECFLVPVDGDDIFQQYIGTTNNKVRVIGYILENSGWVFGTNITDYTPASGTGFQDLSALPEGAEVGYFKLYSAGTSYNWGIRPNGVTTPSPYNLTRANLGMASGLSSGDGSRIVEVSRSNEDLQVHLVGYWAEPVGGPTTETQTVSAKARIRKSGVEKTVQSKARIKGTGITKSVQAKARIVQEEEKTIQAKASIWVYGEWSDVWQYEVTTAITTETKTVTAKARISKTEAKTVQSKARIKGTGVTKAVSAKLRIRKTGVLKTVQAKARILLTETKTVTAKARIKGSGVTKTIQSLSRIKRLSNSETIQSKARILTILSKTISAKARIASTGNTATISAKARIKNTLQATVSAKARILATVTQTITSKARIFTGGVAKTISAKARILKEFSQTIQAKARILTTNEKTIQAKARILGTGETKTVSALARIFRTYLQTISAKARILATSAKTIQARARIKTTQQKTVQSKARIQGTGNVHTISAKATIRRLGVEETVSAKARIKRLSVEKTISAKARIKRFEAQTLSAKARIKGTGNAASISARTRIKKLGVQQTVSARGRIAVDVVTQTISAKARIHTPALAVIRFKHWTGSEWITAPVYVYNGQDFVAVGLKLYINGQFITISTQ